MKFHENRFWQEVVEKQLRRLTLQKTTKVAEGEMYILPVFSLKTTIT
jgi:hypothetical protein